MKAVILGFFLLALNGAGAAEVAAKKIMRDAYYFTKNFKITSIEVEGNEAVIKMKHPEAHGPTRFEFIPNSSCLESFPPQCFGTVVRLDNQFEGDRIVETELKVNLDQAFGYGSPTTVTVAGPKRSFTFTY